MDTSKLRLKNSFTATSADTDMYSRLKLSALTNYLIQSAINSAESLGFGFDDLKEENLFWVLNRLTIEIYRPVMWNEKVEVETWPKNIERIFYIRDFIVRDEKGSIVAKASSAWLAINIENKRPGNFNKDKMAVFSALKDYNALEYSPDKLGSITAEKSISVTPTYFDIDLNKHVTSTRYVDWMMDHFTIGFHQKHYPSRFSINYQKETMIGETICIKHQADQLNHSFEGYNEKQEKVAFRGQIEFKLQ